MNRFTSLYAKPAVWGRLCLGFLLLGPMMAAAQVGTSPAGGKKTIGTQKSDPAAAVRKARESAGRPLTNIPVPIPAGVELIGAHMNGESVAPIPNYWDGVDDNNNLRVFVATDRVLNDVGVFQQTRFPPSVNFVDMNNDKLPDLVVADRYGYLRLYMNSGSKGNPQFTTNTIIPTFLGLTPRIHVADWNGDNLNDIIFGTFYGDFQVVANVGSAQQPRFTTSMSVPRFSRDAAVSFPKLALGSSGSAGKMKPFVLGIYMAPWVMDWNSNGKQDLIFGEGTYSANSVRIAFNSGGPGRPFFMEDQVFFLAYGEGYEQLVPSIVDYNGDGIPDLMCGTRTGHIRLYKGARREATTAFSFKGARAPAAMDFDYNLLLENREVFETMTAPFPCDWNEDGLFDIVMGSTKGVICVAINQGTKTKPVFPKVEPIKGSNALPDRMAPAQWMTAIGGDSDQVTVGRDVDCNSGGYLTSEEAIVLETGLPPVKDDDELKNAVMPAEGRRFLFYRYMADYPGWSGRSSRKLPYLFEYPARKGYGPGARMLAAADVGTMTIGESYVLSFSYILIGKGAVTWAFWGAESFRKYNEEFDDYEGWLEHRGVNMSALSPTGRSWQKKTVSFTCPGTQKGQKLAFPTVPVPGVGVAQRMKFNINFLLPEGSCQFFLDDFSLKKVGAPPPS